MSGVRVSRSLVIPEDEIRLEFTTSGGPGGQHANKSSTRAVLVWNVDASRVLGPRQRARVKGKLRHRIDSAGNLRLSSDAHRSQLRNREAVRERLAAMVEAALRPEKKRVGTAPTRASKEKRLGAKKARSEVKRARRAPGLDE
ncbi:MAG TPA: alternative ribosome rescue aminoacyl-tRNA hydrolase ArfB [Actinomycetota bacterium]|nr:alternative ribosome rescue aminoacyl-tRNA hydrolase ArfB [Actinomycetota bacterium]